MGTPECPEARTSTCRLLRRSPWALPSREWWPGGEEGQRAGLRPVLSLACWVSPGTSCPIPRPWLHTCCWGDGSVSVTDPMQGMLFPPGRQTLRIRAARTSPAACRVGSRVLAEAEGPWPAGEAALPEVMEPGGRAQAPRRPCPSFPQPPGASSQAADPMVGVGAALEVEGAPRSRAQGTGAGSPLSPMPR